MVDLVHVLDVVHVVDVVHEDQHDFPDPIGLRPLLVAKIVKENLLYSLIESESLAHLPSNQRLSGAIHVHCLTFNDRSANLAQIRRKSSANPAQIRRKSGANPAQIRRKSSANLSLNCSTGLQLGRHIMNAFTRERAKKKSFYRPYLRIVWNFFIYLGHRHRLGRLCTIFLVSKSKNDRKRFPEPIFSRWRSVTLIIIFLGSEYEGLVDGMKKQNDHLSSLTFTVGEKGESTLFWKESKKRPIH